jgi:hypothetical protein
LVTSIKDFGTALKTDCYFSIKNNTGNKEILLAQIFALYAILKANNASSSSKKKKRVTIAFKPHEVQVVTLLLILGIVRDKS